MLGVLLDALPAEMMVVAPRINAAAGRATGSATFKNGMIPEPADIPVVQANFLAAHKMGREVIKASRAQLPVGVSLTMTDDQAVGAGSLRDALL
jgi:beta-glucosidase